MLVCFDILVVEQILYYRQNAILEVLLPAHIVEAKLVSVRPLCQFFSPFNIKLCASRVIVKTSNYVCLS